MSNFFARSILEGGVARDLGVTSPGQILQLAGDFLSQQTQLEMLHRELSLKTIRANIAKHALAGILANPQTAAGYFGGQGWSHVELAVKHADALIMELNK